MRIEITGTSVAADTDGYADDVNASAGEAFTLAATEPGDDLAHLVVITPSGSVTGNYTITGTGPEGQAQTETLATDTTNAVTSSKHFATVTEVLAPAGIGAETVDIGWTAESVSAWTNLINSASRHEAAFNFGFGVTVGTGSPTYTVQHTYDGSAVFDHASVASETDAQEGSYTSPVNAIRLKWAAAGQATLTGFLAGGR